MKVRVKWIENVCFVGESESNHSVILDGPEELGGRKLGMRPMEMLLIGMGGCTSFDVVTILKKSRQAISDCYAEIEAERAETIPKVFTKIHIHFVLKGKDLDKDQIERAIKLDRKSTRLNSSHMSESRMPSSA